MEIKNLFFFCLAYFDIEQMARKPLSINSASQGDILLTDSMN